MIDSAQLEYIQKLYFECQQSISNLAGSVERLEKSLEDKKEELSALKKQAAFLQERFEPDLADYKRVHGITPDDCGLSKAIDKIEKVESLVSNLVAVSKKGKILAEVEVPGSGQVGGGKK